MADLYTLLAQYGLAITFASVLLARLGIPLPTLPVLLVAGAMATEGLLSAPLLLLAATSAAMAADTAWYLAGRWYGLRVLRLLCSISLSPDGCVRQAESVYLRHEALSLVASKFVPGLSTVAAPMAGAWKLPFVRFTRYNAIGALAWAGLGIGAAGAGCAHATGAYAGRPPLSGGDRGGSLGPGTGARRPVAGSRGRRVLYMTQ